MLSLSDRQTGSVVPMLVILAILPAWAFAQDTENTNAHLLECDALQDPAEKLACFNAVVEGLKIGTASPDGANAAGPGDTSPELASSAVAAEIESELKSPAQSVAGQKSENDVPAIQAAQAPKIARDGRQPRASERLPAEESPESTVGVGGIGAEEFGADSMRRPSRSEFDDIGPESIQAKITRVWPTSDGRFAVQLDNGQIWRETQGTRIGIPNEGRTVEITAGRMGGYRMKIDNITRIAWVRRTK